MAKMFQFISESKAELKKVVWPKKDYVMKSTMVVIVVVVITSLFLFGVDLVVQGFLKLFWKV